MRTARLFRRDFNHWMDGAETWSAQSSTKDRRRRQNIRSRPTACGIGPRQNATRIDRIKSMSAALEVMMYHYVRDLPNSAFPRLKAMQVENFRAQVEWLRREYEMATLESALAFLRGKYQPKRSL